ncbi:putative minor fimbrial subunit StfE [Serratia marcescens]|nr:putative minor fimbrial subunit StfE [Serratia marcescens]CVE34026.1 putative minor fimbrial subunit StfE [Serratia sp. 2880STDY5682894]CVA50788.1 putative minor fimbrial subunit StfE [Serratia marcescens]CVA55271.1 putative minor fimbrial subunit StfE [Serratia marcescens]CVA63919.1 putative minor fimbrial subunit StfE [Serratia marcescens]
MPARSATNITVSVTVLAPLPCVFDGNKPIEVNFGDEVLTTRIDGGNYRMPIAYSLSCSGQGKNAMKLQIAGNGASFNSQLLQTNVNGLGIALLRNGTRIPLNSWQSFTYSTTLPVLEAVPVRQAGVELPTGEFSASATLRADYQ